MIFPQLKTNNAQILEEPNLSDVDLSETIERTLKVLSQLPDLVKDQNVKYIKDGQEHDMQIVKIHPDVIPYYTINFNGKERETIPDNLYTIKELSDSKVETQLRKQVDQ